MWDDGSRRGALLVAAVFGLAVTTLVAGGVSLVVHHAIKGPGWPYRVEFSSVGDACSGDVEDRPEGLVLDSASGELLYCAAVPGFGGRPAGSGGAFSGKETGEVVRLAQSLADGGGLSDAERDRVTHRAEEIGRRHGQEPPSVAVRVTGAVGPWGLGIGVALLVGLGVVGSLVDRPRP